MVKRITISFLLYIILYCHPFHFDRVEGGDILQGKIMKDYNDFTDEDFIEIFKGIQRNTTAFDGVAVSVKCANYDLLNMLKHDENDVAEFAYHVARLINNLDYLGIIKKEILTDDKA